MLLLYSILKKNINFELLVLFLIEWHLCVNIIFIIIYAVGALKTLSSIINASYICTYVCIQLQNEKSRK